MSNEIKRVVAINDMSCFGKCSLTVALPVISAFGVEAVPLPTAILSTHTGGFTGFTCLDMTGEMKKIINHWKDVAFRCDGIYTGYFLNPEQLALSADFIKNFKSDNTVVLVDPVMGDNGGLYTGFAADFPQKMLSLCSYADVITPNLTEAFLLTGLAYSEYQTEDALNECMKRLSETGTKKAVITGVRKDADTIGYRCEDFVTGEKFEFSHKYEPIHLHGCGDVFSSVLCGGLVKGESFYDSVKRAADFTERCILTTEADIENHWYGLKFEKELLAGI